jgi:hypothetical protein
MYFVTRTLHGVEVTQVRVTCPLVCVVISVIRAWVQVNECAYGDLYHTDGEQPKIGYDLYVKSTEVPLLPFSGKINI